MEETSGQWLANYTIQFHNENAAGDWRKGKADLTLIVRANGQELLITSQKDRIYEVAEGKAAAKPVAVAQPKGVPITVPKPCYVATMRAKDLPQIEITDQIHFTQSGYKWHRTYREFSKDGKVINTCRAIYEGTVRLTTGGRFVHVGSQGWERGLGTNAFIKTCERSARALVGRSFHFEINAGAMVESSTGRSFRLQK